MTPEPSFWEQIEPFLRVLRQALLMIVRWIEDKYGLTSR